MTVENLEFIGRLDSLTFDDVPRSSRYTTGYPIF